MAGAEQRVVGDDQVDGDRDGAGADLAGDPLDEGVGHDLAPTTTVSGGDELIGHPAQGRPDRDPLRDGQQRGELRHGVGAGRSETRRSASARARIDEGLRVEAGDQLLGLGDQPSVAPSVERVPSGRVGLREEGVDQGAVLPVQARGLAGDQGRAPLGQVAGLHRRQGVRQLAAQRAGQAEQTAAASRGLTSGERDLGCHAAALLGDRQPQVAVLVADQRVEPGREPRLGRAARPFSSSSSPIVNHVSADVTACSATAEGVGTEGATMPAFYRTCVRMTMVKGAGLAGRCPGTPPAGASPAGRRR